MEAWAPLDQRGERASRYIWVILNPHQSSKNLANPQPDPFSVPLELALPLGFEGTQAHIVALIGFKGV